MCDPKARKVCDQCVTQSSRLLSLASLWVTIKREQQARESELCEETFFETGEGKGKEKKKRSPQIRVFVEERAGNFLLKAKEFSLFICF